MRRIALLAVAAGFVLTACTPCSELALTDLAVLDGQLYAAVMEGDIELDTTNYFTSADGGMTWVAAEGIPEGAVASPCHDELCFEVADDTLQQVAPAATAVWQLPVERSHFVQVTSDCKAAPLRFSTGPVAFDSGAGPAVIVGLYDQGVLVYDVATGETQRAGVGRATADPFTRPGAGFSLSWFFVIAIGAATLWILMVAALALLGLSVKWQVGVLIALPFAVIAAAFFPPLVFVALIVIGVSAVAGLTEIAAYGGRAPWRLLPVILVSPILASLAFLTPVELWARGVVDTRSYAVAFWGAVAVLAGALYLTYRTAQPFRPSEVST